MMRYNNIFLSDTGIAIKYSSTGGGGSPNIPQREDRQKHSNNLIRQFQIAQKAFNAYTSEQVAPVNYNSGTYFEVIGAENYELVTKSLENTRQGIKLLNVRDEFSQQSGESITTKATVFIPNGKEEVFLKKIRDYADITKQTKTGKPQNGDLVKSIEEIKHAVDISAFWVGRKQDMPNDVISWYELWLEVSAGDFEDAKLKEFTLFDNLKLEYRNEAIIFPERLVIMVKANRNNLLGIIKQGITIAEIRKPSEPNAYFLDSEISEQSEWADDLLKRTVFNETGVTVCILDTGINHNHILIQPYMPLKGQTVETVWGANDDNGHGTNMAGVVLYNDIRKSLETSSLININHTIESVKILGNTENEPKLYGAITKNATLLAEIASPKSKRIYCMAVTAPHGYGETNDKTLFYGEPSSWSASIDQISSSEQGQLFIISSGNVEESDLRQYGYPEASIRKSVEDPAQSWNALTVGAYALDTLITSSPNTGGYFAVAQEGELSPYSTTSNSWKSQWPIKPELVCDGGNVATDGSVYEFGNDDLSKLTLDKEISRRLFGTIYATSAATAQCSYIAAELLAAYPNMRLETVRALLVHSARWTDAMQMQCGSLNKKTEGRKKLLRTFGYGIPNLSRAKDTFNNCVNLIIEEEIQPFEKTKLKDMHLHNLPWPIEVLQPLENTKVKVRVTLSYFIEPGPGQKGWKNKYRYASCGLRFDIRRPNEELDDFQKRINKAVRDEEDGIIKQKTYDNWYLGINNRNVGSIHSDVWEDTAINLSESGSIAVYPVGGWWKERINLKKYNSKIHYSLIISIETPEENIDFYTPIMTKIASKIPVEIATNI